MKTRTRLRLLGAVIPLAVAGCVETTTSGGGTTAAVTAPPGMVDECIRQIRVGRPNAAITVRDPILAGPDQRVFVGMAVDGVTWGCRIEDNGSYTAFPNFAN